MNLYKGISKRDGKYYYGTVSSDGKENYWIMGNVMEANQEYISHEFWEPVKTESIEAVK